MRSEGDTTPGREPLVIELLAGMQEDRTEAANRDMVELALRIPDLVATLFAVRDGDDPVAVADCADTITKIAARDPEVIQQYQAFVVRGLDAAGTQVRWESLASLALLANDDPSIVEPLLPRLRELIERDTSVIVRDRAIDALTAYGVSSPMAARQVLPILEAAIELWNGKHAARALRSLCNLAPVLPHAGQTLRQLALTYADADRPSVRAAARHLLKAVEEA